MALVLVYQGQEVWIGNDDIEPKDSAAHYRGALKGIASALDSIDLAKILPIGSTGAALTYAASVRVVVPMGPITKLTGKGQALFEKIFPAHMARLAPLFASFSDTELNAMRQQLNRLRNALASGTTP